MNSKNIKRYLAATKDKEIAELFQEADRVRKQYVGDGVLLRGIVEFSNYCRNSCAYCGLNKNNKKLNRYRLTEQQIMDSVKLIASKGIKTVVLQSGEEDDLAAEDLAKIIQDIKNEYDLSITLSLGERTAEEYKLWREAGADRYLLKIETTDQQLYERLHKGMSFTKRLACLDVLQELGYQTGTGNIVGLPGQTVESLTKDILFFKQGNYDMIGIGPLIPHAATELASAPKGSVALTLKVIALTRIVTKDAHLPATTALGSLSRDYRLDALECGANVLMPNFTPRPYNRWYELYPEKRCLQEDQGACADCMQIIARSIGRYIDYGQGDSLKKPKRLSISPAQNR